MLTCILRFADQDLMMRYHWGSGVGHHHAHQATCTSRHATNLNEPGVDQDERISNMNLDASEETSGNAHLKDGDANDDLELSLEDRHLAEEGWQTSSDEGGSDWESDPDWEPDWEPEYVEDEIYTGL
jgi:hypothetical protein